LAQLKKKTGLAQVAQLLAGSSSWSFHNTTYRWEWKKKGSAREKEGHNDNKIGVLWAWDTDRIQAGEASARGDGERGTLTEMPQQDHAAYSHGSGARHSCDLSTSAAGNGHRDGQSPECSNKLVVLTGGKGKKKTVSKRERRT